jgi:hypothetical protein
LLPLRSAHALLDQLYFALGRGLAKQKPIANPTMVTTVRIFIVSSGVLVCAETRRTSSITAFYQARREGNKAIERSVIASFGIQGDFRAWEHLLRIHE